MKGLFKLGLVVILLEPIVTKQQKLRKKTFLICENYNYFRYWICWMCF